MKKDVLLCVVVSTVNYKFALTLDRKSCNELIFFVNLILSYIKIHLI